MDMVMNRYLRRDGEDVDLLMLVRCRIGQRAVLIIDLHWPGVPSTLRQRDRAWPPRHGTMWAVRISSRRPTRRTRAERVPVSGWSPRPVVHCPSVRPRRRPAPIKSLPWRSLSMTDSLPVPSGAGAASGGAGAIAAGSDALAGGCAGSRYYSGDRGSRIDDARPARRSSRLPRSRLGRTQ